MTRIETLLRSLLPWSGRQFDTERPQKPVEIDDLSTHMLRDLGMSRRDAQDLVAVERARFL